MFVITSPSCARAGPTAISGGSVAALPGVLRCPLRDDARPAALGRRRLTSTPPRRLTLARAEASTAGSASPALRRGSAHASQFAGDSSAVDRPSGAAIPVDPAGGRSGLALHASAPTRRGAGEAAPGVVAARVHAARRPLPVGLRSIVAGHQRGGDDDDNDECDGGGGGAQGWRRSGSSAAESWPGGQRMANSRCTGVTANPVPLATGESGTHPPRLDALPTAIRRQVKRQKWGRRRAQTALTLGQRMAWVGFLPGAGPRQL
ncbi:hypothetical protein DBV05_g11489 [Lasiodiplodia theobromae]|uniref:Uncharacterized protein n=1 Tax=Lasiodiplodia theobromae TaxID=45133 RepID=A0A5N5CX04_9PEZI|nr:hypothetical protein DBV05_g11489 [Lasiodiplodia theobromae]